MGQITARLPDELVGSLDKAAARLRRTRAQVVLAIRVAHRRDVYR